MTNVTVAVDYGGFKSVHILGTRGRIHGFSTEKKINLFLVKCIHKDLYKKRMCNNLHFISGR